MVADVFKNSRTVFDPDISMVAMRMGRKLDRLLRTTFEDIDIFDL